MVYCGHLTHFNHKNIVRGTTSWEKGESKSHDNKLRDFNTLEEHNKTLIKNINDLVSHDDVLYHLGDWSFGGFDSIKKFRDQLNCREIHLIYGNHDHHIERNKDNIQSLFASTQHVLQTKHFFLSHYGHRVWSKSHKGSMHLYGHSHGSLPGLGRSMDVGVDTNNLRPYCIEELIDKLSKIDVLIVDHHNSKTN